MKKKGNDDNKQGYYSKCEVGYKAQIPWALENLSLKYDRGLVDDGDNKKSRFDLTSD